jgi:LacI family transcriptional regulator
MVTIKDVARRAGVSTATVSHVINGTRRVLPETRDLVLSVVDAMNYRPSAIARGLTTSRSKTVGVVIADVTSPFFAMLLYEVERLLSQRGYNLIVCNTYEEAGREAHNLEQLLDKRVDGVIITPTGHHQLVYEEFNRRSTPMVFIDRKPERVGGSFVGVDSFRASYDVTRYLIDLGHERIGLVSLTPETSAVAARVAGYHDAFEEAGLAVDPALVTQSTFQIESAERAVRHLLSLPEKPSALIAGSHVATLGALQALAALELHYPRDVSLVCFDNSRWTGLLRPALTVMTKPVAELAQFAVDTLLAAFAHADRQRKSDNSIGPFEAVDQLMDSRFVIRDSCQPLVRRHGKGARM